MIDFDVETTGLQPWSGKHHAFLYVFSDGENHVAYPYGPDNKEHHDEIQRWFDRGKEEGIRAWNHKFDRAFADATREFDVPGDGTWHDGMVVAHVVDERRSVALKSVAKELFGDDAADDQKKVKDWLAAERRRRAKDAREAGDKLQEPNYGDVPMEIMEPYALEDVILTRKISEVYDPIIEAAPDLKKTVEFEREAGDALFAIEKRGIPADAGDYRKLEQEVTDNLSDLEDRVHKLVREADPKIYAKELGKKADESEDGQWTWAENGGSTLDFNPNSTAQILAALKARGADMSYMSEKNGKLSADADNLRAVDDELAAAILDFRSEFKVLSTYVRPMIKATFETSIRADKEPFIAPDGRIHANYRQVGARTGRMSCSDPNMQNQPRDDLRLRYNIRAEPGHSLVACDLSNIEMVLFAAYCGEGRLLDAVKNGEDLHMLTAKMLGLRDRKRPGGGIETARQLGKTYNFSRVYGGGLRTIRRSFRCSLDQARLLKSRFDDAYPEVKNFQNIIEFRLQDQGYIQDKLISGRRFRVDPRDAYKATNYVVQGTAAALLKYAVSQLHKDGVPMVALIHDEVLCHVPKEDAEECANLVEKRMTEFEGLKGIVPLSADAQIVQRWSDAKPMKDGTLFVPKWDQERLAA